MTLTSDTVHIGLSTSIQRAKVDVAAGVILHPVARVRVPEVMDDDVGEGKEEAGEAP